MEILIKIGTEIQCSAKLYDTETASNIFEALPLEGNGNTWGEEIYFSIPVAITLEEDARDVLEAGELGYWPNMQAFCLFYGPTPASRGNEIRAAGPVNVFGKITGDLAALKQIKGGEKMVVERK